MTFLLLDETSARRAARLLSGGVTTRRKPLHNRSVKGIV